MTYIDAPEPDPDYTVDDAYNLACIDGSITAEDMTPDEGEDA